MGKHLVFVGGGHAHLTAILHFGEYVKNGFDVTLISSSPYHYYSGMGPGMLGGIYRPEEVRFHIARMAEDRGARFIGDTVVTVDPKNRILVLSSGKEVLYDAVSFNTGSDVPPEKTGFAGDAVFTVKPIENLLRAQSLILKHLNGGRPRILVIGGGPAGVEISGNAWRLVHDHQGTAEIMLVSGRKLLARFPERARRSAMKSLESRGIRIIEHAKATISGPERALLSDGQELLFEIAFIASGIRPSRIFKDSGLPTGADGGLLVNSHLQSISYPEIFGGGDCISLEGHALEKVGVYAVRQNLILSHNLPAFLGGQELEAFQPQRAFMLIFNMGDGTAILTKKNLVVKGKLAFALKNYIDRKFMREFQVSGEQELQKITAS